MKKTPIIFIVIFLFSCSKKPTCETWDMSIECVSTNPQFDCNGDITNMTEELCNEALKDAHAGKDKVFVVPGIWGVKRITHYIKKVK